MSAVYFIKVGRFVKIGFSSNPTQRAAGLLRGHQIILPKDFDLGAPVELLAEVPGCRIRDERNMQLLFGAHWVAGEWFRWSPAFLRQMRTIRFVTHEERLVVLRRARASLGITSAPVKEEKWGMNVTQLQEHCRAIRAEALARQDVAA